MNKVHFSKKTLEDLSGIWNYTIDAWSVTQADKYYANLVDACRAIPQRNRHFDREYVEIVAGLYGFKFGKHIIFYRELEDGGFEVVRILHERMDLKRRIRE